jgi:ABC-type bacteriocin/lantibiotic exporter with double-glycine peptidase domain
MISIQEVDVNDAPLLENIAELISLAFNRGKIFFDDLEITSRNRDSIRSNFAFVPQKVQLIEGTLKENILFGSTLSNDNKDVFLKAISLAELDEVIESLPNGLNTVISETNPIVSGGQKQCIGFARAFFKQRHILVLDEATSAMDQSLEAKIINNISIIQFKMVIAITHKGSILEYFNKICILQDGKIEACDSFSKLEPKNIFLKQMLEKN